jgi:hypothetical protein
MSPMAEEIRNGSNERLELIPYSSTTLAALEGLMGSKCLALGPPISLDSPVEKAANLTDLLRNLHLLLRNADLPPSAGSSF